MAPWLPDRRNPHTLRPVTTSTLPGQVGWLLPVPAGGKLGSRLGDSTRRRCQAGNGRLPKEEATPRFRASLAKILDNKGITKRGAGRVNNFGEKVSFIWSVADLLRGPYRPNPYKDEVI